MLTLIHNESFHVSISTLLAAQIIYYALFASAIGLGLLATYAVIKLTVKKPVFRFKRKAVKPTRKVAC